MIVKGSQPTRRALKVAAGVLVGCAALEAIAIAVLRRRWTPGIEAFRRVNRRILNPAMLKVAGRRHWYAAALHHVGRSSGKAYVTPLVTEQAGEHVYIPLPYGDHVDWCRNVLAAGSCTIEDHGAWYDLVEPEIVPASVAVPLLPARRRCILTLLDIDSFLRGRIARNASALRP
jgi:deazaflavin-dependent oxidoreductase (nitroreductase family)